jgi:hypothetical protein
MSETPVSDTVWRSFRRSLFLRVLFVTVSSQMCAQIWPGRTLQNINVLSHTHKTQLHFSLMYFWWNTSVSDHKRRTAFPSANNCKVNCKILSLYQYFYMLEFLRRCYYSGVTRVCSHETTRIPPNKFSETWQFGVLFKFVDPFQFRLNFYKNNGHFHTVLTRRICQWEKMFWRNMLRRKHTLISHKLCSKN